MKNAPSFLNPFSTLASFTLFRRLARKAIELFISKDNPAPLAKGIGTLRTHIRRRLPLRKRIVVVVVVVLIIITSIIIRSLAEASTSARICYRFSSFHLIEVEISILYRVRIYPSTHLQGDGTFESFLTLGTDLPLLINGISCPMGWSLLLSISKVINWDLSSSKVTIFAMQPRTRLKKTQIRATKFYSISRWRPLIAGRLHFRNHGRTVCLPGCRYEVRCEMIGTMVCDDCTLIAFSSVGLRLENFGMNRWNDFSCSSEITCVINVSR